MLNQKIPVLDAAGKKVGEAYSSNGWKAASRLLGRSAAFEFRTIDGRNVGCWVPSLQWPPAKERK